MAPAMDALVRELEAQLREHWGDEARWAVYAESTEPLAPARRGGRGAHPRSSQASAKVQFMLKAPIHSCATSTCPNTSRRAGSGE